jgi:hypothetical protein
MDKTTAIGVCYAVGALTVGFTLLWLLTRRPSEAERAAAARARIGMPPVDSYEGPDSLRLMQELDAHLDSYMAHLAGLYERPHIGLDPVHAAGLDRLRDAIRDQTKGEL